MTPLARLRTRHHRAAAELFGVVVVAALAAAALTAWTVAEFREQAFASQKTVGRTAAAWLRAAHRATQEDDWTAVAAGGGGLVTPASLAADGHAPPGLPAALQGVTMSLGVIADGTPAGVPMAFLVIDPDSSARTAGIHAGLIEAGITGIEHVSGPAGLMAAHRPAIEALVGALDTDAFFVTADSLPYVPATLYRRPQPGRPHLNRMETDLAFAGNALTNAAALHAGAIDHLDPAIDVLDPTTWPGVTTSSTTAVSRAAVVVDPASLVPGTTTIDTTATLVPGAATLAAGTATFAALEGAGIDAQAGFTVTADLAVGTLVTPSGVAAASATVTGALQAAALQAATVSAQETAIAGDTTVSATLATTSATTATIAGSPDVDTTTLDATGGVYGPTLTISGALTATSCDGC